MTLARAKTNLFLEVPTRDGFEMEAMLIKPPDFDPSKRHPVLQYNYGGPHAPVVRNVWGGTRYLWHQLLAQRGYVIWMCDNRSASGKGMKPTWEAYGRLRPDPQHQLQAGERRRAGHRLAALRLDLHRALHGVAGRGP